MLGLLLFLLMLGGLLLFHELGHFIAARIMGFKVPVFGFGLPVGPSLLVGALAGTQFRLHVIPLGAYVTIPELTESNSSGELPSGGPVHRLWQRLLVCVSGILPSILYAWLAFTIAVALNGLPVSKVTVLGFLSDNPIAANAGLKPGDVIDGINSTDVNEVDDVIAYLRRSPGQPVTLHVLRQERKIDISVAPNAKGRVGMILEPQGAGFRKVDNLLAVPLVATQKFCSFARRMVSVTAAHYSSGAAISPAKNDSAKGSAHGMLAVLMIGGKVAWQDWRLVPMFVVMVSLDIALLQLIPWPGTDAGHIVRVIYRAAGGKPASGRMGKIFSWLSRIVLVLTALSMPLCLLRCHHGAKSLDSKTGNPDGN